MRSPSGCFFHTSSSFRANPFHSLGHQPGAQAVVGLHGLGLEAHPLPRQRPGLPRHPQVVQRPLGDDGLGLVIPVCDDEHEVQVAVADFFRQEVRTAVKARCHGEAAAQVVDEGPFVQGAVGYRPPPVSLSEYRYGGNRRRRKDQGRSMR